MTKVNIVAIGSDPEFGVWDNEKHQYVSVIGLLGGTKQEPLGIGNDCSRQEDNVMAEFCIPPAYSEKAFVDSILYCKEKGTEILKNNNPNLEIRATSSNNYTETCLSNPVAQEFGCSISFNAYTQKATPTPKSKNSKLRSAGFHIHVSYKEHFEDYSVVENVIKVMDLYLGLPSVIIDLDKDRRELYGKAGEFRVRTHEDLTIVEYRSLGGNLLGDKQLLSWAYQNTVRAIDYLNRGNIEKMIALEKDIRKAINTSNEELAAKLIKEFEILVPEIKIYNENLVINQEYATK